MELKKSRIKYKGRRYEQPISAATDLGSKLAIAFLAREDEVGSRQCYGTRGDVGVYEAGDGVRKVRSLATKWSSSASDAM